MLHGLLSCHMALNICNCNLFIEISAKYLETSSKNGHNIGEWLTRVDCWDSHELMERVGRHFLLLLLGN